MRAAFLVTTRSEPPCAITRLPPQVGHSVLAAITMPALIAPRGELSVVKPCLRCSPLLRPGCCGAAPRAFPVALLGGLVLWWPVGWTLAVL